MDIKNGLGVKGLSNVEAHTNAMCLSTCPVVKLIRKSSGFKSQSVLEYSY